MQRKVLFLELPRIFVIFFEKNAKKNRSGVYRSDFVYYIRRGGVRQAVIIAYLKQYPQ